MNTLKKFDLTGRLAIITGGAGLLGIQHSEALIEANAEIIILDNDRDSLKKAASHFLKKYNKKICMIVTDITKEKSLSIAKAKVLKKFNRYPDILINNAAIDAKYENSNKMNKTRLENFDLCQWNKEISVGLSGAFLCSKYFGTEMANNKKGVILNISSDLGLIAPNQSLYASSQCSKDSQNVKPITYSVIKHGLIGLTRYISTYWANKGVRCNALAPGGVFNMHDKKFTKKLTNLIPLGRMANVDEYKSTIIYMCSDASSYMNGAILSIDGGRTAW